MARNWAAHELLETTELLRKLTADIELHALCSEMTTDQELKSILRRHIETMDNTYHQGINLLQNKGLNTGADFYHMHGHRHPHVGIENPHVMPAPNPNATRFNDMTIGTLILNTHKAGAMFGMVWANECVDPDVRGLHVMSANNCQQMAYEIWQYMNTRGYYEAPSVPMTTVKTVTQTFQPAAAGNAYGTHHMV
ncbi:MAG: spore coat protein [Bacillaceae bacterium]|nr:spore coat protein [Bacillaceae bacterium]